MNKTISSGYKSFNQKLGPFKRGALTIIAGRPKMGKSLLMFNIGLRSAKENKVLVWDLEGDISRLKDRFWLFNMQINDDIYITYYELIHLLKLNKTDLLIVDYLQLQPWSKNYTEFLRLLKHIAESQNLAVLISSQLSSEAIYETDTFRPNKLSLIDTPGNETCSNYIDKTIYLHREQYYNSKIIHDSLELYTISNQSTKLYWGDSAYTIIEPIDEE